MNPRERTLASINGTPDKVPFNPFIMHVAATLANVDYCHVYCQDPRVLATTQVACADFFGIDHVNVSTDAWREASAWGVELNWDGGTPDASKFLTFEEFDGKEDPDLNAAPRVQERVEAVRFLKEQVGDRLCVVGWIEAPFAEICCLFGLHAIFSFARHPDWPRPITHLIDRVLPIEREFAQLQIEAGADVIGSGDSVVSQIGPRWYERCGRDAARELFQSIQQDVPVLYHICGNNAIVDREGRDMLQLVASTGANVFDFDCEVDLTLAREKIGPDACIRGNTDTKVLGSPLYSPAEVATRVFQTIEAGKSSGRYMYAAGCEWPWEPRDLAIRNLGIAKAVVDKLGDYV